MMIASKLPANSSGLLVISLTNWLLRRGSSLRKPCTSRHVVSVGRQSSYDDEEPFWLSLIRETIWGITSLSVFLVEQPSQLKYIEWPSFVSTLETAILTPSCRAHSLFLRRTP
ncbi:hypothetical protein HRI_001114300 [Hibiscus trionum]|uniref:Uncharacterized protein n=1 Tax=Hibiscus trionum TaxID=183268 RepID=A0A9W7LT88_HIBTR|nr:hypothetical protein HRI_001114300 [Hibiscus trionum]